tara:strand:- start:3865 stop:4239 length:375 start_codon:yes stop_codon:yes gene_type:complete
MPTPDSISCCANLSGLWNEETTICSMANLGASKHDIQSPCTYSDTQDRAFEKTGFPLGLAKSGYKFGATIIYFLPSLSEHDQNKDIPPSLGSYEKRVIEMVNIGIVGYVLLIAVGFYLYKKIRK